MTQSNPLFRLSRYFSVASLLGLVAVLVVLSGIYRHVAIDALIVQQTRSNAGLAKSLANSLCPKHAGFIKQASRIPRNELPLRPEISALRADVLDKMAGLDVFKVKIYDLNGVIVFSTDPRQIGQQNEHDKGFITARQGQIASEITFRDEFSNFEQSISDRNLVTSYIPLGAKGSEVQAVLELYSDVTSLVGDIDRTQRDIVLSVTLTLGFLYLFLLLIVKRAENIMRQQDEARRTGELRFRKKSFQDTLTGLTNRKAFAERIRTKVKFAEEGNASLGLMFIDIDRLKVVNNSMGHGAGDRLLKTVARRIQCSARETDSAYYMGGDEFSVILETLRNGEDAAMAARRLIHSVSRPINIGRRTVTITVSVGIATYPKDASDDEGLLKCADAALSHAKDLGGNTYKFCTKDLHTKAIERLKLETELSRALKERQFRLYYQPKVLITTGHILGMEALLRWQHPELGTVSPGKFLSVLEDTGFIVPVGAWVMRTACQQNKAWQQAGLGRRRVSVNVSPRQFRDGSLIGEVSDILDETGLEPRFLELELTEDLLVENTDTAIEMMKELKRIGVFLSIDDFGSGYSSLTYLNQFPVDILKIDRVFINNLFKHEKDDAIVRAIIGLAHSLKLKLVAEGVEKQQQVEFLQAHGCNQAQGYLFSRPLPADEFSQILSARCINDVAAA